MGEPDGVNNNSRQSLPSYNNNYEQRYQTLQYNINQKTNSTMTPYYSHSHHHPMSVTIYEVRFKCTKGDYLLASDSLQVNPGDFIKVEADRGYDIGVVFRQKNMNSTIEIPRKRIIGHIGPNEMSILPHKIAEETQATLICRQMANHRGLLITIADVEFQFDRNKLTAIFASEGRVDFRELVRDMFSFFRVRIWMQKVSPAEAVNLMELAAADSGHGGTCHHAAGSDQSYMSQYHPKSLTQSQPSSHSRAMQRDGWSNSSLLFRCSGDKSSSLPLGGHHHQASSLLDSSLVKQNYVDAIYNARNKIKN